MSKSIREFMEMTKRPVSKADELLDSIFAVFFDGFKKHFQLSIEDYSTVSDFFEDFSKQNPKHQFVAEWFLGKGMHCVKQMDTDISIINEIEAFLEFEKVTLEIDVYEGSRNDFLFAMTERFPSISNFITEFYEEGFKSVPLTHEAVDLPIQTQSTFNTTSTFQINLTENTWSSIPSTTSSANKAAGLLLYA